jgi:chromosome segregation ATPase
MGNEKYLNYYVEVLTGTMTDAVIRNISLQASNKIADETIAELSNAIQEISQNNEALSNQVEDLQKKYNDLVSSKAEYDNVKHQVEHIDTFRTELIKEREAHEQTRKELNDRIEYLQLTPAKRKKIDEANKPAEEPAPIEITEDGGLF